MKKRHKIISPRTVIVLLRQAFKELNKNDPLRMAGATAFFTTFGLPPILVILIQGLGLIFDRAAIRDQLFRSLTGIWGMESTQQVGQVLSSFRMIARNAWAIGLGFVFLLFVATTLFNIIKNSFNQIWKIKVMHHRGLGPTLGDRLRSILVIFMAGVLFVVGLLGETAQAFLGSYISDYSPAFAFYFNTIVNYIISIGIVTLWFAVLFRYLPDGRPTWGTALVGGFVTSMLFNIGKVLLRTLLQYSNVNNLYGASGSIVLIMLFVFYSSLILYYGTAFTKVWGIFRGHPIQPLHYANHYHLQEDEDY
ncbi:MAG TPA: YihY/virulence factor BrkB family protein [Chitinophagaceae bacterium]